MCIGRFEDLELSSDQHSGGRDFTHLNNRDTLPTIHKLV